MASLCFHPIYRNLQISYCTNCGVCGLDKNRLIKLFVDTVSVDFKNIHSFEVEFRKCETYFILWWSCELFDDFDEILHEALSPYLYIEIKTNSDYFDSRVKVKKALWEKNHFYIKYLDRQGEANEFEVIFPDQKEENYPNL